MCVNKVPAILLALLIGFNAIGTSAYALATCVAQKSCCCGMGAAYADGATIKTAVCCCSQSKQADCKLRKNDHSKQSLFILPSSETETVRYGAAMTAGTEPPSIAVAGTAVVRCHIPQNACSSPLYLQHLVFLC
jgi:hypothetical protein